MYFVIAPLHVEIDLIKVASAYAVGLFLNIEGINLTLCDYNHVQPRCSFGEYLLKCCAIEYVSVFD
jgi:hypothetical protein